MDDRTLLIGTAEERILTCLKAAGWYKGRRVGLAPIREFYAKGGIVLPTGAERFLQEYHGLSKSWYLNIPVERQAGRASDIEFSVFPNGGWQTADYFDGRCAEEFAEDLKKMNDFAGEPLVWIASIGYYYSDSVYMGSTDKIFALQDDGNIRTYYSVVDMLRWDFEHHPKWEFVTFGN